MIQITGFKISIECKAATTYERRRACQCCEIKDSCTPAIAKACRNAFIDGYKKGYKQSKHEY